MMDDEDTPDNMTIASVSYLGEEDSYSNNNASAFGSAPMGSSHGNSNSNNNNTTTSACTTFITNNNNLMPPGRKRKRDDASSTSNAQDLIEAQHCIYGDELLDYFLLSSNSRSMSLPVPPPNYLPNWAIDRDSNTALHWASAMGDVEVMRQLRYFNASLTVTNVRGETPLMRAVNFSNCCDRDTFVRVLDELYPTISAVDNSGCTVFHHAIYHKNGHDTKQPVVRYYLETMLNRARESHGAAWVQRMLDAQDADGNTALHLAAHRGASKCIRLLLSHNASPHIPNKLGVQAVELIDELNASRQERASGTRDHGHHQRSSSLSPPPPPPPQSSSHLQHPAANAPRAFRSAAATAVQSRSRAFTDRLEELARKYEEEVAEKDEAETEARRILAAMQRELDAVNAQADALEERLGSDAASAQQARADVGRLNRQVLNLVARQNWTQLQHEVDEEVARTAAANGESSGSSSIKAEDAVASATERIELATRLRDMIAGYRQAETDYVEALSNVGTGDRIEKYRRLLTLCLGQDADRLDENLDRLIETMEEQQAAHNPQAHDDKQQQQLLLPHQPEQLVNGRSHGQQDGERNGEPHAVVTKTDEDEVMTSG
jgi:ankyrin repeat protein